MYVPEKHPITKQAFHEREDEGHVFKVCIQQKLVNNYNRNKMRGCSNCY